MSSGLPRIAPLLDLVVGLVIDFFD
jgi:hypothetical protein